MTPSESAAGSLAKSGSEPAPGASNPRPRIRVVKFDHGAVAERPRLADGVELSGEMPETGFQQQQWLAQRDGRFIQLTEMLYAIAELANGTRTTSDIAEAASERLGRKLVADNVRELIARKLIPLGLIVKADGTVEKQEPSAARSPLAVNMRMAMVSPRFIDPFTKFLQYLFLPPVIAVVLLATCVAQGWLFFIHGVANGAQSILYQPGLLLALLGMVILSTAWHEFGHASALTYGGGKVRGMGAGLYLVYPAFYTDVTDNYRLGRWARVRTDLGGFYFNLIFSLAMIGLYQVTGAEFLLILVVLIDVEILHQTLPFVRLDGYWALADATGIPDFFSQIGPFLRTVLPLPFWKGPRLPNLKVWVKAVFALYIAVTVPLLTFLFLAMVKSVPRVLATGYDSMRRQVAAFQAAQSAGSATGSVLPIVQLALLALPTLGLVYALYLLGQRTLSALWGWARSSTARRGVATLVTAAGAGLLVLLWLPQLPFTRNVPGPLYAGITSAQPIVPSERGTLDQVFSGSFVPFLGGMSGALSAGVPATSGAPAGSGPTATLAPTAAATVTGVTGLTGTVGQVVATATNPDLTPTRWPANAPSTATGFLPTATGTTASVAVPPPVTTSATATPCVPALTSGSLASSSPTALPTIACTPTSTATPRSGAGLDSTPTPLPYPETPAPPTATPIP